MICLDLSVCNDVIYIQQYSNWSTVHRTWTISDSSVWGWTTDIGHDRRRWGLMVFIALQ